MARVNCLILSAFDLEQIFNVERNVTSLYDIINGNPLAISDAVKALLSPVNGFKTTTSRRKGVRTLMKGLKKADYYNNGFSGYDHIADIASEDAFSADTVVEATTFPNSDCFLRPSGVLAVPVNVTGGMIVDNHRPVSNYASLIRYNIHLYSAGSPAAPPADYHQIVGGPSASGTFIPESSSMTGEGVWDEFMVPSAQFAAVGAGANLNAITWGEKWIRSSLGQVTKMQLGPLYFVPNKLTKPKFIFCFDDAKYIPKTMALLNEYGFPAVFNPGAPFMVVDVGASNLSIQQMQMAVNKRGWQMASQAAGDEQVTYYDQMSDAQIIAAFAQVIVMTQSMGLTGWQDGSYFSGVDHRNLRMRRLMALFFRTLRTYLGGLSAGPPLVFGEMFPWGSPQFVRALSLESYPAVGGGARMIAHPQQAIANGGVAIGAMHNPQEGDAQLFANLTELVVWLDTQRAAIDVVTFDDLPWYN